VFIDPLPSADDYEKMYARSYHEAFYFKDAPPDYAPFSSLLEKYSKYRSILDYGCGDGSFVRFFFEKGYTCAGVEYDPELVKLLRLKMPAIDFYTVSEFDRIGKEQRFGIIYLGDVLEHLADPNGFIRGLQRRLSKNGLIMIQGPLENNGTFSLAYRKFISWLRAGKPAAHVPYHISFSNAKNQKDVFEKNGFTTLYYTIYETSWPLPGKFSFSPATSFKWAIAKVSMFLSKLSPGKMGNRFIYLGRYEEPKIIKDE
jgi:2-polyprenyl-3-methyl-5-hydroxy-6-metoxy-1,4-benzoquinol methylase